MSKNLIRNLGGYATIIAFAAMVLGFLGLPIMKWSLGGGLYMQSQSVFSIIGEISRGSALEKAYLAMYLLVAIVACLLIIAGITGLVLTFVKKDFNFALVNRILSIILIIFAFIAMTIAIAAISSDNNVIITQVSASISSGGILPFAFAIFPIVGAFIVPSKRVAKKAKK